MAWIEEEAEKDLNRQALEEEFGLSNTIDHRLEKLQEMRSQLEDLSNAPDPDDILLKNIERANRLMDLAEAQAEEGEAPSNRTLEVISMLINAVTTAANSIVGSGFNQQVLEQKSRALDLKQQELEIKKIMSASKLNAPPIENNKGGNVNVFVSDRETVLKMIRGESLEKEEKVIDV
jgi:hypothetical protein